MLELNVATAMTVLFCVREFAIGLSEDLVYMWMGMFWNVSVSSKLILNPAGFVISYISYPYRFERVHIRWQGELSTDRPSILYRTCLWNRSSNHRSFRLLLLVERVSTLSALSAVIMKPRFGKKFETSTYFHHSLSEGTRELLHALRVSWKVPATEQ